MRTKKELSIYQNGKGEGHQTINRVTLASCQSRQTLLALKPQKDATHISSSCSIVPFVMPFRLRLIHVCIVSLLGAALVEHAKHFLKHTLAALREDFGTYRLSLAGLINRRGGWPRAVTAGSDTVLGERLFLAQRMRPMSKGHSSSRPVMFGTENEKNVCDS